MDRATDVFWGLFSHAPVVALIRERGWTVEEYADFPVDAVDRLLLR